MSACHFVNILHSTISQTCSYILLLAKPAPCWRAAGPKPTRCQAPPPETVANSPVGEGVKNYKYRRRLWGTGLATMYGWEVSPGEGRSHKGLPSAWKGLLWPGLRPGPHSTGGACPLLSRWGAPTAASALPVVWVRLTFGDSARGERVGGEAGEQTGARKLIFQAWCNRRNVGI